MSFVATYSFQNALPMSIGVVDVELLRELELAALVGVLDDRFLDRVEIGAAGAREAERLVELHRSLEVADVDAVLADPAASSFQSAQPS